MHCSVKAVILLALTTIAIQYTAIRTLTSMPFQLCPLPSPQNCGQDTEPPPERAGPGGCDELPDSSVNATRKKKTHILILATTRSGSSFVGQLINQHQDVFYLFEPLYHVQNTLLPRLSTSRFATERRLMLGASRDLLRSICVCDLYFLESYIKPTPTNHTTDKLFRRGVSRALCQQPVCDAFGPADVNVEEGDCIKKCPNLNMTLATEACREKRNVALKIVRVPEVEDLRALVEDPRLNIKVIQLVRDPRGILSSRIETFRDAHPHWLKGKYMLVRYEDLARSPLVKTREIYDFLGLSLDKNVKDWIQANTQGTNEPSTKHKFGTMRDSAANAESWRLKLSYDMVEYTQTVCQKVLHQLGYKAVRSPEELKNMSLSLVQDRTFLPA
ncbi:unnamed protein product [Pleuronectes platessa]|uniref:Sulfotransferase n=1 Tax=Pleuronectes platessa TaxID=8262 RepID=A0A9N7V260_PLEPL|nr:unnamed protein product [Pleuronectes platessa]